MKFRPLHDRVVIRRAEGDLTSKGGIIIPDTAKDKPQDGEDLLIMKEADIMGIIETTETAVRKGA